MHIWINATLPFIGNRLRGVKVLKCHQRYPDVGLQLMDAHFSINLVDPEEWFVSDDLKKNSTKCCQICDISEDIARTSYKNMSTLIMEKQ